MTPHRGLFVIVTSYGQEKKVLRTLGCAMTHEYESVFCLQAISPLVGKTVGGVWVVKVSA